MQTIISIAIVIGLIFWLMVILGRDADRRRVQGLKQSLDELGENQSAASGEIETAGKNNNELKKLNADSKRHIDAAKQILRNAEKRNNNK